MGMSRVRKTPEIRTAQSSTIKAFTKARQKVRIPSVKSSYLEGWKAGVS